MKHYQIIVSDCPWKTQDQLRMSSVKRGASSNYPVMGIEDLCALPVNKIADPNGCVLALWVLGSMLEDGMKVMKAWGFTQKQVYVWVKTKKSLFQDEYVEMKKSLFSSIEFLSDYRSKLDKPTKPFTETLKRTVIGFAGRLTILDLKNALAFGMGRLFRQTHEICLIGINSTKIYTKLENKSQRSVCFANNEGHSIKPSNLQSSLEKMFPTANKLEMFARRNREGWDVIGNDILNGEDISVSLQKMVEDNSEESIATKLDR